jgi:hypothetical protein
VTYRELRTEQDVGVLVKELVNSQRSRPVVVVSTKNGELEPLIDVQRIVEEASAVADIVVIPTGRLTYLMGDLMRPNTHVYGGAGRTYPPGDQWQHDLRNAPLRLARSLYDSDRATGQLIDDAFKSAPRSLPRTPMLLSQSVAPPGLPRSNVVRFPHLGAASGAGVHEIPSEAAEAIADRVPEGDRPQTLVEAITVLGRSRTKIIALEAQLQAATISISVQSGQLADARASEVTTRTRFNEHLRAARSAGSKTEPGEDTSFLKLVDLFPEVEDAVRHSVCLAWVSRVPASEKPSAPLPVYQVGARFAASLHKLDQAQTMKAFRCAVDVLTGKVKAMPSRRAHILRNGDGVGSPAVTRLDDAICWRVNVETGAASARRLHYWKLPNGRIELSRVVVHDDMLP